MSQKTQLNVRRMVALALFAALAYVCTFFFHIKVLFLTFDAKDAVVAVAGMCFGPGAAAILSLLTATLEFITMGETGLYGFLMDMISGLAFTVPASLIYRYRKTTAGALFALGCGVSVMTAIMLVANLFITPLFMGSTVKEVVQMIPTLLLPFNVIKALLNAALVLVLYKPISTTLRRMRMLPRGEHAVSYRFDRRTVIMLAIGLSLLVLSLVLFFAVLDGKLIMWDQNV
jgi:riboflavin transporter FmnP